MNDKEIYRCYVEKQPGFDVAARTVKAELSEVLRLPDIELRLFNRYDIQYVPKDRWMDIVSIVLSEPVSDIYYEESLPSIPADIHLLHVEPLPGQFDVRADSCEQCIQMLLGGQGRRPIVKTAMVYAIGGVGDADFMRIKEYLINPLETREALPDKPETLIKQELQPPGDIPVINDFIEMDTKRLDDLRTQLGLAMSPEDLQLLQAYFHNENRDPTLTELRMVDTYWSDHCRHTTFNTVIESADIQDQRVKEAFDLFLSDNGGKPVTLMHIATAAMKRLELPMLDISDENNACTVRVKADFAHGEEDWLLFFKNETHNHPTEIEPYGGASTCIGGAIRDPLSGRAYVYQSMRITGSGDPRRPIEDTLPGKLPQRKLTVTAAEGFSSYGNQIGLATGFVKEIYHEGYVAKRLEAGAVVGAAPLSSVRRERPAPGDVVVLLGGRTGRDGVGGATGSSKMHGVDTVSECASEVQKGNAPEERKLQRLFRNPDVTRLIKKCNDFGAGGATVAIGELADGVEIDLDAIPVKYDGLDGTELALSESQERMAVVIAESDLPVLLRYAESENIEASAVARVTESKRLVMTWRGRKIVDIDRAFLDTNGAERHAAVYVPPSSISRYGGVSRTGGVLSTGDGMSHTGGEVSRTGGEVSHACGGVSHACGGVSHTYGGVSFTDDGMSHTGSEVSHAGGVLPTGGEVSRTGGEVVAGEHSSPLHERLLRLCGDLNFCSQKGLAERFDSSIGTASVFMPFGGKYALTETQVMAALLPAADVRTASVMAYGFDPYFTEADTFGGSAYAVVTSVAKLIASGVASNTIHLSLQEYFPPPGDDPLRWGQPFSAMLGAFSAQMGLNIAAIGGKDSMSGSYTYLSSKSGVKPDKVGLCRGGGATERSECSLKGELSECSQRGELSECSQRSELNDVQSVTTNVPPTLISFAVGVSDASRLISPEFKGAGHPVYLLETPLDADGLPDYNALRALWEEYAELCCSGKVLSAWACETGGVYGGIIKMAMGNMTGFSGIADARFFDRLWGSIIFESATELEGYCLLGYTQEAPALVFGNTTVPLTELCAAWESPLEGVFPVKAEQSGDAPVISDERQSAPRLGSAFASPKAVIPVFPGTNCEYDTVAAIERAGGKCEIVLVRNLTPEMLQSSIDSLGKAIASAQMLVLPGGFSGGDEPDGSGKFIVSLLRNPSLTDAVHELLQKRDGLILGICNGFQALIKLGLLPYGRISTMTQDCPTLTLNTIGRHQSRYISTRVASVISPWLSRCVPGEIYVQPISHGEGRFAASAETLEALKTNGQIAFQYVDHNGYPSMDIAHNPNGSAWAVEGICSPDGRVLGKMAHTERCGKYTAKNISGKQFLPLFEGGVDYFS